MNCEQFRDLMHDLARDELRDSQVLEEGLIHGESCRECDALLAEADSLTTSLRLLQLRYRSESAPADVETAILHVFTQKHSPPSRVLNRPLLSLAVIAGVAAVALLAIALTWHTDALPQERRSQALYHTAIPSPSVDENSRNPQGPATASIHSDSPLGSEDEWLSPFGEDDAATDSFVPLSDTFDPGSIDEDAVIRVVLPREALESFGFAIDEGGDQQVLADLIIANDGTPQAIHLVSW